MKVLTTLGLSLFLFILPTFLHAQETSDLDVAVGSDAELTYLEKEGLYYLREQTKLVRDLFHTFYNMYGTKVYTRIARKEQRHFDRIGLLLEKYQLEDPVVDKSVGIYENPIFEELFHELSTSGSENNLNALYVGAYLEEIVILDLKNALLDTEARDIRRVYEKLLNDAKKQLRLFVRNIEKQEVDVLYQPQNMTEEDLAEILRRWDLD